MILNLALFFGWHVFWPQGWAGPFDAYSLLICGAALLALFRFHVGIIPLIAACTLLGLAHGALLGTPLHA